MVLRKKNERKSWSFTGISRVWDRTRKLAEAYLQSKIQMNILVKQWIYVKNYSKALWLKELALVSYNTSSHWEIWKAQNTCATS